MNLADAYHAFYMAVLVCLSVLTLFCLFRAIQGPRIADRIVSINMICTLTMTMICILAAMLGEGYLVDVALIYALLGFLAVVVLCKVYMGVAWRSAKRRKRRPAPMLDWFRFVLTVVLMLAGLFVLLVGVVSQYRFRYVLNRMHAASMGDSLGMLLVLTGLCISQNDGWVILKYLLTALFLWLTSPTGSHLIARLELTTNEHPEQEMEMIDL